MRGASRLLILLALSIGGGFFAGRAYWSIHVPPSAPPSAPPPAAGVGGPALERLPALTLPDLAGTERSLEEWSRQALLVNFWATWCAPCRKEMPLLEQLHQERRDRGLAVVGIAIDREEPVRSFVAETGVSYPILVGQDTAMAAAEAFGPQFVGLPLTAVAAPGGEILGVHLGELHPEDLTRIAGVVDEVLAGRLSVAQARQRLEKNPPDSAGRPQR